MKDDSEFWLDCQIVKERCEDSPGILIMGLGDSEPTADRVAALRQHGWLVLAVSNSSVELSQRWLDYDVCIGAFMVHEANVMRYRRRYPEKLIYYYDNVMLNAMRTMTQVSPTVLPIAGLPYTMTLPYSMKTIDLVGSCGQATRKRIELTLEAALLGNYSMYLFCSYFGANPDIVRSVNEVVARYNADIRPVYMPFEPYPLFFVGDRVVIDSRPFGANNGHVPVILDRARLFLHTSSEEAFSNSVIEALMRNVPVLLCNDIEGPLPQVAQKAGNAITFSSPEPSSLVVTIREMLDGYDKYKDVRSEFSKEFDPFEINRTVIRNCQELFTKMELPWKGHCPGLMGENPSHMNLACNRSGQEAAAGCLPIYPNPGFMMAYLQFHIDIAQQAGNAWACSMLKQEKAYILQHYGMQPVMEEDDVTAGT